MRREYNQGSPGTERRELYHVLISHLPEGGRSRGRFSLLGGVARCMVALLEGEVDFKLCWAGDGNREGFGLRGAPAPESKQLTTMTTLMSEKTDGDWGGEECYPLRTS